MRTAKGDLITEDSREDPGEDYIIEDAIDPFNEDPKKDL